MTIDNAFAGHNFPSGAAQDRRAWVEIIGYRSGAPVFTSGVVPERIAVTSTVDPNLWLLRDKIFTADGSETHLFWQAARFESEHLTAAVTADPKDPRFFHAVTRTYPLPSPTPDRLTMRVRMRPVDFELLDDLASSKDLDPAVLDRVPTFQLGAQREWTSAGGFRCIERSIPAQLFGASQTTQASRIARPSAERGGPSGAGILQAWTCVSTERRCRNASS